MYDFLISLGGLSLERLRNFTLIADAGSLSRAAHRDAGRMALFSRQIKELESFFGVELRRRRGKGIVLTEAGTQLATLARQHFSALEEFQRRCRQIPQEVSVASGNSLIEWQLLPRVAEWRRALPGIHLRVTSARTRDIVDGLQQNSIDFGLIRAEAVRPGLHSAKLRAHGYSLFVPRRLAPGLTDATLRRRLSGLPVATSTGGEFRSVLEAAAAKAKWILPIELSCSSFTQAARAVASGSFAGVLPDIALAQFDPAKTSRFELPFMKGHVRQIVLAWHPRAALVRDDVRQAKECLVQLLR